MPAARVPLSVKWPLVLLLVAACGDPDHSRQFPRWVMQDLEQPAVQWRGCAGMRAFVRKSGKQGIGITLEIRSKLDCPVDLDATAVLSDGTTSTVQKHIDLHGRSLLYQWLAFHFDGDRAWNRGARSGRLDLALTAGGEAQPVLSLPMVVEWNGVFGDGE
jgi:hypothetical protein